MILTLMATTAIHAVLFLSEAYCSSTAAPHTSYTRAVLQHDGCAIHHTPHSLDRSIRFASCVLTERVAIILGTG